MSSPPFPFLADAKNAIDDERDIDNQHFNELTAGTKAALEERVRFVVGWQKNR